VTVTADGAGVVSHSGSRLLADLAEASTLTGRLSLALTSLATPQTAHDPGRVLADLAVAIADGAECISDIAVLSDQAAVFGAVASDSTVWRLLDRLDERLLGEVALARAAARGAVWAQRAETTGAPVPAACAAARALPGLVIDLDATIVISHSDKQQATPTYKHTYGFHPMLATLDNSGEFLAAILRPGNAGANTAADHIAVLDAALAQIPDEHRHGEPILVRADTAGASKAFLAHVAALRASGVDAEFSIGWRTDRLHDVIHATPKQAWVAAIDTDGEPVDSAQVAELTGLMPTSMLADYPVGMRVIVRREHPHPGAQLNLFEERDGWRYTAFATTTQAGQLAHLDARHRAHARVEDRIRVAKDTGLGRFPSHRFAINAAWLTAVMIATDLTAWAQTMLLHDTVHAKAEPKLLRYRLLHVAARITRGQRRVWLRLDRTWRWATDLARAFARCAALPQPAT
jgi:hypothetical protein